MKLLNILLTLGLVLPFNIITNNAQNVIIPDVNFKTYLLNQSNINTNGDGEIQISEAASFSGRMECYALGIIDLTGIEKFTALTDLVCSNNLLTSIDITQNINLRYLYCNNNQLTTLDITQNTALEIIYCGNNQLTSLDLSQNVNLSDLYCNNNQLTFLDISQNNTLMGLTCNDNQLTNLNTRHNVDLSQLECFNNQLTTLDLSQNVNLSALDCNNNQLTTLDVKNGSNANIAHFETRNNTNLTCIKVDDEVYSTTNWINIDSITSFSTICNTNVLSVLSNKAIIAYPNPTQHTITLDFGKIYDEVIIEVSNISGQKILIKKLKNKSSITIPLKNTGIHFGRVKTKEGERIFKIIRE